MDNPLNEIHAIVSRALFSTTNLRTKSRKGKTANHQGEITAQLGLVEASKMKEALRRLDESIGQNRKFETGICIQMQIGNPPGKMNYRVQISQSFTRLRQMTFSLTARLQKSGLFQSPLSEMIIASHPNGGTGEAFSKIYRSGLLLVAGQTGSGKTQLCGHLVKTLVSELSVSKKPVLITIEDPPELLEVLPQSQLRSSRTSNIPVIIRRELPINTDLEGALKDALRETPDLVYIGEVRDARMWPIILEFAKTGHRILTTSHAGSIRDCLLSLMQASGGSRQSIDSLLAALFGLVHVTSCSYAKDKLPERLPSCWWATPLARNQFSSSGIASLVPSRQSNSNGRYFLGRSYFAERIGVPKRFRDQLLSSAIAKDLFDQ